MKVRGEKGHLLRSLSTTYPLCSNLKQGKRRLRRANIRQSITVCVHAREDYGRSTGLGVKERERSQRIARFDRIRI
uniref:Uncharacterized protein n=1 Tax=Cannabis sativa TaxID=3483 RepID=A0A803NU13_CANSA